jgi:hypothetical protein
MENNMIKLIRLTSGEELICEAKKDDSGYNCTDISLIMPTEKGVGLMDWMPYSQIPEKGVFIKNEIVFLVTDPVEGFLQQYKSIHSKIITPSQGLIT